MKDKINNCTIIPAAMRGRYKCKNKTVQKLEIRHDGISNAITTVQKDSIIIVFCKVR